MGFSGKGALSYGAKGAGVGASVGGPIGAAIGGGVGAIAGGLFGGSDKKKKKKKRQVRLTQSDFSHSGGSKGSQNGFAMGGPLPMTTPEGKVKGPSHEEGGVMLPGGAEVEGGETIDQIDTDSYVFSDRLTVPDSDMTFAEVHEALKEDGDEQKIRDLARLQEQMNGDSSGPKKALGGPVDDDPEPDGPGGDPAPIYKFLPSERFLNELMGQAEPLEEGESPDYGPSLSTEGPSFPESTRGSASNLVPSQRTLNEFIGNAEPTPENSVAEGEAVPGNVLPLVTGMQTTETSEGQAMIGGSPTQSPNASSESGNGASDPNLNVGSAPDGAETGPDPMTPSAEGGFYDQMSINTGPQSYTAAPPTLETMAVYPVDANKVPTASPGGSMPDPGVNDLAGSQKELGGVGTADPVNDSTSSSGSDEGTDWGGVASTAAQFLPAAMNMAKGLFSDSDVGSPQYTAVSNDNVNTLRQMETDVDTQPQMNQIDQTLRSVLTHPQMSNAGRQSAYSKALKQKNKVQTQAERQEQKMRNQKRQSIAQAQSKNSRMRSRLNSKARTRNRKYQMKADARKDQFLQQGVTQFSQVMAARQAKKEREEAQEENREMQKRVLAAQMAGMDEKTIEKVLGGFN